MARDYSAAVSAKNPHPTTHVVRTARRDAVAFIMRALERRGWHVVVGAARGVVTMTAYAPSDLNGVPDRARVRVELLPVNAADRTPSK